MFYIYQNYSHWILMIFMVDAANAMWCGHVLVTKLVVFQHNNATNCTLACSSTVLNNLWFS